MRSRSIGQSGIQVSRLALGTMNFGSGWCGRRPVDLPTASSMLDAALDSGVNLIDTADIYGYGASESMLGSILGGRRKKVVLATKVSGRMRPDDPSSGGLSARHIREALDDSLRRLKTDHIDLYMAHAPDPNVPIEETLEAFGKAVKAGKARVVGCSNFSAEQLKEALKASGKSRPLLEFNQVEFSLMSRDIEADLVPLCRKENVRLLAWSPMGGGVLARGGAPGGIVPGRVVPGGAGRSRLAGGGTGQGRLQGLAVVLGRLASARNLTSGQAALGWALSKPWLCSAVFGVSSEAHLREALRAEALCGSDVSILDRASELVLGARS